MNDKNIEELMDIESKSSNPKTLKKEKHVERHAIQSNEIVKPQAVDMITPRCRARRGQPPNLNSGENNISGGMHRQSSHIGRDRSSPRSALQRLVDGQQLHLSQEIVNQNQQAEQQAAKSNRSNSNTSQKSLRKFKNLHRKNIKSAISQEHIDAFSNNGADVQSNDGLDLKPPKPVPSPAPLPPQVQEEEKQPEPRCVRRKSGSMKHLVNKKRLYGSLEDSKHREQKIIQIGKQQQVQKSKKQKLLLNNRYQIKKKLSQGGFGKVYLGKDLHKNTEVVVKVNSVMEMNANEFQIMKVFSGIKGFPRVFDTGMIENQPYIVQEKLGMNINDILREYRKHFSIQCIMSLGICLINLLEKFHDKGYIHCDIKPDNIMIGDFKQDFKAMNNIYLIDFGISNKYLDEHGNHIRFCQDIPFKGNLIFSSKNAFAQCTLSRRDDIISLMYLLIYLIDSKQCWINLDKPVAEQYDDIARYKIKTKARDFLTVKTEFMYPILKYAYCLKFDEKPNYEYMRFMLKKVLLDRNFVPQQKYDWSLKPGEKFTQVDEDDCHSSISSCNIDTDEQVDQEGEELMRANILKHKQDYNSNNKHMGHPLLEQALPGTGDKYFKIPENFVKIGEYQYMPNDIAYQRQVQQKLEQERLKLLEYYQRALNPAMPDQGGEEAKVDHNGREVGLPPMTEQQKNALINLQIRLIQNQQQMLNHQQPSVVVINPFSNMSNLSANSSNLGVSQQVQANANAIQQLQNSGNGPLIISFVDQSMIMGMQGGVFPVNGVLSILGSNSQSRQSSMNSLNKVGSHMLLFRNGQQVYPRQSSSHSKLKHNHSIKSAMDVAKSRKDSKGSMAQSYEMSEKNGSDQNLDYQEFNKNLQKYISQIDEKNEELEESKNLGMKPDNIAHILKKNKFKKSSNNSKSAIYDEEEEKVSKSRSSNNIMGKHPSSNDINNQSNMINLSKKNSKKDSQFSSDRIIVRRQSNQGIANKIQIEVDQQQQNQLMQHYKLQQENKSPFELK